MYKKILNDKLVSPPHFSATAQDLLARVSRLNLCIFCLRFWLMMVTVLLWATL